MKILEVTHLFAPNHGGGAEAPYQLSRHLVKAGYDVTVWTSDYKMNNKEYLNYGGKSKVFHTNLFLAGMPITFPIIDYARRHIKEFDLIHLHNARTFQNIVVAYYAQKYGIPYIYQAHGGLVPVSGKICLKKVFDIFFNDNILDYARYYIAANNAEKEEYRKVGIWQEGQIEIIPPLYNITEYESLPVKGLFHKKYNIMEQNILLYMGRIHQIKGLDFLIDTYDRLISKRGDTILVIVGGDGGYEKKLKEKIESYGLTNQVLFTGILRGNDKLSALVDANVLLQLSTYERGAGSPFEAVLSNTPIIVTNDTGAGNDVAKIDAGYLIKYGDINGLLKLIEKVLDSPDEIKQKTEKAKQYIKENLSWKVGIGKWEDLYKRAIALRSNWCYV